MAETSKSEREMGIQIQKAQRTETMIKAKKSTLKHITVNLSKAKRILKTAREKQLIVKTGNSYNSINRFLSKLITGQNGVGWYIKRSENYHIRVVYKAKSSFKMKSR